MLLVNSILVGAKLQAVKSFLFYLKGCGFILYAGPGTGGGFYSAARRTKAASKKLFPLMGKQYGFATRYFPSHVRSRSADAMTQAFNALVPAAFHARSHRIVLDISWA